MPYDNCDSCKKCLPCPVTSGDKNEGAYHIANDEGNIWYCSSCFYCEDVCPEYSPRQYAIEQRRKEDQESKHIQEPLEKIRAQGQLFEITKDLNDLRKEFGLPEALEPNTKELDALFKAILSDEKNDCEIIETKKEVKIKQSNNVSVALFLGCLIPYRVQEYELSARNILKKMEIDILDLPFSCCGSVMAESHSEDLWLTIAAYNLALAEEQNISTLITLCGGCCGNLRRVKDCLVEDTQKRKRVNQYLAKIGKNFTGKIKVRHLSEYFHEIDYQDSLASHLQEERVEELATMQFGIQVPCQVIRPEDHSPYAEFESKLIAELLKPTKITVINYQYDTLCCGSAILQYNEELAFKIAEKRIAALVRKQADGVLMGCGNCSMNYKLHQKSYTNANLPAFFFTEIIDFAIGAENPSLEQLIKKKKEKKT